MKFLSIIKERAKIQFATTQLAGMLSEQQGGSPINAVNEELLGIIADTTKNKQQELLNQMKMDLQNLKRKKIELLETNSGDAITDPLSPKYDAMKLIKELHNIELGMERKEIDIKIAEKIIKEYFTTKES